MYNFAIKILYIMISLFKKRSKKEKLLDKYGSLKKKSYELSKINRKERDKIEFEANMVLLEIKNLKEDL